MNKIVNLLIATLLASSVAVSAQAADYVLSLNLAIPPIHNRWNMAIKPFCDEITKRSEGRIVIEPYFAQALSKQADIVSSVKTGIADLGEGPFGGHKLGTFPFYEQLMTLVEPSRCIDDAATLAINMAKAFPEEAAKDTAGTKLLFLEGMPTGMLLGTRDKPVRSIEDLKGLKIGVTGGGIRMEKAKALGLTVVGITIGDMYMSLEKGVIDGAILDCELLISRKVGDIIKYLTPINFGGGIFYCVMNPDVYNSMPDDLKKVIDDVSTEFAPKIFSDFWGSMQYNSLKKWQKEMGGTLSMLSQEEYDKIDEMCEVAYDNWRKQMSEAGFDEKKILDTFRSMETKCATPWLQSEMAKYRNDK